MMRVWLLTLLVAAPILAQPATLEAPDSATVGSPVEVRWTGPGNDYDSVYVIEPSAADAAGGISKAAILNGRNPLTVTMPDQPGVYELRYWDTKAKAVVARRSIAAVDVETVLEAPDSVDLGSEISVAWRGPGNDYDTIGVYPAAAGDDARSSAGKAILSGRNPIVFKLPEQPGEYELRYVMSRTKRILARRPLTINAVEVSLEAPERADFGSEIEVAWRGPGNDYDLIALYPAGAPDEARAVGSTAILRKKNPVAVRVPETAGDYELRYVTATSKRVLGRRALRVGGAIASLASPNPATAMTTLPVRWQGPGNDYDQIALHSRGAADDAKPLAAAAILQQRNPVQLELPAVEGEFELRYVTAREKTVLARWQLTIEPAGRLVVVFEREGEMGSGRGAGAVELILDASGSMLKREGGIRRIEIARQVLGELVAEHLTEGSDSPLRDFGHKEADSCRTDLEIALGPLDRTAAAGRIASIEAMNLAKTPIADSLARVPSDLAGVQGPKTVVLITDGEETCDGDPAAVIESLRAQGLDLQVSIVGFAIDDAQLKSDFETWADLGGGSYFDARSADELKRSLRSVISGPFQVLDADGRVVATGIIGGAEIVLPPGLYRVETVGSAPSVLENVEIRAGESTRAAF